MYACMHVCNMPCRDCNAFCNIPYPFYWSHRTHDPYIPSICITSSDYLVYKQHRRTAYTIFKISLPQRTNQTGNLSLLLTPSSVRVAIIAMELQQMRPVSIVGLNVSVEKILTAAQREKCSYGELMYPLTVKHAQSLMKYSRFFVRFRPNLQFSRKKFFFHEKSAQYQISRTSVY